MPSPEGAGPAFKHSTNQFEKLLEACEIIYKQGYLVTTTTFDEKPFREKFPEAKEISRDTWRHAYLALKVSFY